MKPLTPCDPKIPVSWQIYVRRVYASAKEESSGSLWTVLDDEIRVTDPKENYLAHMPSVVWNEELNRYGLVWLESSWENGVVETELFFDEFLMDYTDPFTADPFKQLHVPNQKISLGLNKPSWPCLAANGDRYAVVYQDRRSPYDTENIYFDSIDPSSFSTPIGQMNTEIQLTFAEKLTGETMPDDPDEIMYLMAGAQRPKIIRSETGTLTASIPGIKKVSFDVGEDVLVITWEEKGKPYLMSLDAEYFNKTLEDCSVAYSYGYQDGIFVTPAVGCHTTGLASLHHRFDTGELHLTVTDYEGARKYGDAYINTTSNPRRVDDGANFSGYPAVAWSGGIGDGVYGVAWEDGRSGNHQKEIYFRAITVRDTIEYDCKDDSNEEICTPVGYPCMTCEELCASGYKPDPNAAYIPDGKPVISVEIEEVESSPPGTWCAWVKLNYRIAAYSASGSRLDTIKWEITGLQTFCNPKDSTVEELDVPVDLGDKFLCPDPQVFEDAGIGFPYEKNGDDRYFYELILTPEDPQWQYSALYTVFLPAKLKIKVTCRDDNGEEDQEIVHWP